MSLPTREAEILAGMIERGEYSRTYLIPALKPGGASSVRIYFRARLERGDVSYDELSCGHPHGDTYDTKATPVYELMQGLGLASKPAYAAFVEQLFPKPEDCAAVIEQEEGPILVAFRSALEQGIPAMFGLDKAQAHRLAEELHVASGCGQPLGSIEGSKKPSTDFKH